MDKVKADPTTEAIYAVIKYIMAKQGEMTAMKLHKLLYYCQAWSLVWDEERLFSQKIEAWANGPVVPEIYQLHRGKFLIGKTDKWFQQRGKGVELTKEQKKTIDVILGAYGQKDSEELSRLTHKENPWKAARKGVPIGEKSNKVITAASMAEYYSSLL